jgi:glucuronate isomerase
VTFSGAEYEGARRRFFLESDVASDLYHRFAKTSRSSTTTAIFRRLIADDHRFRSMTEIWLDGDHYKWRAMRTSGVSERYCTGDATDWEKFEAWARTVPDAMRSPLYHWTHMELRRPFGVTSLLSPATARQIFDRCNERLREDGFTTLGLLCGFRVAVVCTTDDPVDSLDAHRRLAERAAPATRVYPTWRPDRAFGVADPDAFNAWVARLEAAQGYYRRSLDCPEALSAARSSMSGAGPDHGLETMAAEPWTTRRGRRSSARVGQALAPRFARLVSAPCTAWPCWTMRVVAQQFHSERCASTQAALVLGPDTGFGFDRRLETRAVVPLLDWLTSRPAARTILQT